MTAVQHDPAHADLTGSAAPASYLPAPPQARLVRRDADGRRMAERVVLGVRVWETAAGAEVDVLDGVSGCWHRLGAGGDGWRVESAEDADDLGG